MVVKCDIDSGYVKDIEDENGVSLKSRVGEVELRDFKRVGSVKSVKCSRGDGQLRVDTVHLDQGGI